MLCRWPQHTLSRASEAQFQRVQPQSNGNSASKVIAAPAEAAAPAATAATATPSHPKDPDEESIPHYRKVRSFSVSGEDDCFLGETEVPKKQLNKLVTNKDPEVITEKKPKGLDRESSQWKT